MGGFKPYVGAGVEYMAFFGEGRSALGGAKIKLDNAFGFALQAGFDMEVGQGWYLNADVKKVWLDTDARWEGRWRHRRCRRRPLDRLGRSRLPLQSFGSLRLARSSGVSEVRDPARNQALWKGPAHRRALFC